MKKILAILLALTMIAAIGSTAFAADDVSELPREETLYFAGQQWGAVNSWNIMGTNQNNSMVIANTSGYRSLMFETLFMYNFLNGELTGLLADSYEWNDDLTEVKVVLKDAAKWCDGTPVTSQDVVRTWEVDAEVMNTAGGSYSAFVDSIEAVNDKEFVIYAALNDDGDPVNPLKVNDFLIEVPIAQAAWIDKLVERCGGDTVKILNDPGEDVVWSGPYTKYFCDDQKVVLIRDDNYWGQDASMWGKLPVPKYIGRRGRCLPAVHRQHPGSVAEGRSAHLHLL